MSTPITPKLVTLNTDAIGDYLTRLAGQEGLYVGLGLGVLVGGLLTARDIKTTLEQALAFVRSVEEKAAEFQQGNVIIEGRTASE